jgi:hypothetical protein
MMDPKQLTPLLIAALVIFALYRRVRRSFGRQPLRRGRLMFRAGLLLLVATVLAVHVPYAVAGALAGGVLLGVVLGFFGLRHTRFETTATGPVYIPHTYIGLFVTSLLIVRLLMRYFTLQTQIAGAAARDPWVAYQHNPVTLAILGLVIGYYVFYNVGLLLHTRAADQPSVAGASAGAAATPPRDGGGDAL